MNASDYKEQIGDRIRLAREALGLSQVAFAKALGEPKDKINAYEHGRYYPDPLIVHRMWTTFRITSDFLYLNEVAGLPHSLVVSLAAVASASKAGK